MALNTDTFKSLQNEFQFKGITEHWRKAILQGNKLPDIYVGISGTILYAPGINIDSNSNLTAEEYSKYALPTKLSPSCLLEVVINNKHLQVHRIVAETFKNECFIYNRKEIKENKNRNKNSLNKYLKKKTGAETWVVHHKDNNANNNSVPNLVWLLKSDHPITHPNNTFGIKNGKLCRMINNAPAFQITSILCMPYECELACVLHH